MESLDCFRPHLASVITEQNSPVPVLSKLARTGQPVKQRSGRERIQGEGACPDEPDIFMCTGKYKLYLHILSVQDWPKVTQCVFVLWDFWCSRVWIPHCDWDSAWLYIVVFYFHMHLLSMILFSSHSLYLLLSFSIRFICKERGGEENFAFLPSQCSVSVLNLQNEALEKQLHGGNISLVGCVLTLPVTRACNIPVKWAEAVSWGSHHSPWEQQPGAELSVSFPAGRCAVAIRGAAGSLQLCGWWLHWCQCLFLFCLPASWRLGAWMSFRRGSLPWTPWWSRRSRRSARSTSPSDSPSSTPSKPRSGGSRTSEPWVECSSILKQSAPCVYDYWTHWFLLKYASKIEGNTSALLFFHSTFVNSGMPLCWKILIVCFNVRHVFKTLFQKSSVTDFRRIVFKPEEPDRNRLMKLGSLSFQLNFQESVWV